MNRARFALGILTLVAGMSLGIPARAQPAPAAPGRLAIAHAQAHLGDGTVVADATVVIEGERIVRVGGAQLLASLDATTKVVDARGRWLTPGFIATDTGIGLVEIGAEPSSNDLPNDLNAGIVASFEPSRSIRLDNSTVAVAAVAGFTGALVGNDAGLFAGHMSFVALRPGGDRASLVRASVAQRATLGTSGYSSRIENLARMRHVLDDARFYLRTKGAFDRGQSRALAAHPLDLAALEPVLRRQIPLVIEANRASDLLECAALAKAYNLDVVIVGGTEGWMVAKDLAQAKIPVLVQPTQNLPASYSQLNARLDNAALMHAAGVTLLLADVESAHMVPTIKQEAGIAVAHGVPHEAAIAALTSNVARAFHLEKDYGTIAAGKFADIVLWTADPFEFSTQAELVIVHGQEVPLRSRQTLLRERYRDLGKYRP